MVLKSKCFFFFFIFASILFISLSTDARLLYETPTSGIMVENDSLKRTILIGTPASNYHRGPVPTAFPAPNLDK